MPSQARPTTMPTAAEALPGRYHQQYLAKNPDGYCGPGGTGVACPAAKGVAL